jgi:putative membrane protein
MRAHTLPYCGLPPLPADLLDRFNLDPVLLVVLAALTTLHLLFVKRGYGSWQLAGWALAGWALAAAAFVSPLCALSVALFSARVAQHMVLILLAAPLIALGWPIGTRGRGATRGWLAAGAFFPILWFWHMPKPYDWTFSSTPAYWAMHISLFGSAIALWRELLHHSARRTVDMLVIGALTSMQMGLLGAILTFATRPLFFWHLTTTAAWDLTPLRDQQLGGALMWVPGIALFLFAAIRSFGKLLTAPGSERAA